MKSTHVRTFLKCMEGEFKRRIFESLTLFLGVNIEYSREEHRVKLHQSKYIDKLLEKFGSDIFHGAPTPMVPGLKLEPVHVQHESEIVDPTR